MSAESRIVELKLELPPAPKPGGTYHPVLIHGNLALVSGHGPVRSDGVMMTGKVGETMTEAEADAFQSPYMLAPGRPAR